MTTPISNGSTSAGIGSSSSPSVSFFGNTPLSISRSLAASNFLAGDESITIIPSFHLHQPLELLSGTVEPFRAGMNATVPLWLAAMLRRRKLAKIVPPPFMDMDVLKEVLRFERDINEASFSPQLPFRHAEISRAILSACQSGSGSGSSAGAGGDAGSESEIRNADQIKLLLEDIAAVRMDKIRRNIHQLSASTLRIRSSTSSASESIIDVTNIGSLEMHSIKSFVLESFRLQRELSGKGSSYSQDVEMDPSSSGGGGGGGSERRRMSSTGGGSGGMDTNVNRSRLQQQSRLVRESVNTVQRKEEEELLEPQPLEEDLMEPRPLEEDGEEEDRAANDEIRAGRSRLRRHR